MNISRQAVKYYPLINPVVEIRPGFTVFRIWIDGLNYFYVVSNECVLQNMPPFHRAIRIPSSSPWS